MSLVITCYNQERYIKDAIVSCFNQEYDGPLQFIIVDDASTDNSLKIIEATVLEQGQNRDVEIVKLEYNRGVAGATDAGWAKTKHNWILMVDGDDIQMPQRCQYIKDAVTSNPDVLQLAFCMKNITSSGKEIGQTSYASGYTYEQVPEETILDTPESNFKNWFGGLEHAGVRCLGAAFSRKIYNLWGALCQDKTEDMRFEQDPVMAFRAALLSNVMGVKKIALQYRSHDHNLTNITLPHGYKGIIKKELFQDKYQAFHAASLKCMLRDLARARKQPELTNWTTNMLNEAEEHLRRELAGCEMRYLWWKQSWFERVRRAFYYFNKVQKKDNVWLRLLPFHIFCFLKYITKR